MSSLAVRLTFRLYKTLISPIVHVISPSQCLYLPTCSEYAYIAIDRFGLLRGSWLALRRVARCHPWGKGGLDPVPERTTDIYRRESNSSCCNHPGAVEANQTGQDHLP